MESKVGGGAPIVPSPPASMPHGVAGEAPAVKAYDAYVKSAVVPLAQTCDDLGGLKNMGQLLQDAWEGVRVVVVLASRSKAPTDDLATALGPHLAATQNAVKSIRNLRLDREWDCHYKAIVELLACLSWILYRAPQALPAGCVKEALGSAEFWSNRIRKDYKGKDDQQIAFCDNLKKAIAELVDYINEYHKTGLTWNPRGISLVEAAIRLSDDPIEQPDPKSPLQKRHPTLGAVAGGGNLLGLMGELNKRKNSDGSSAATGLKHVSKDQQTWRKEYKKPSENGSLPSVPDLEGPKSVALKKKKTPLQGLPIFEYQDRGFKWVVENHTKESVIREASKDGILTVDTTDSKQQVYLYNCEGVTVIVKGKFKSLILDKCTSCSVIFDTIISSTETVNCKKVKFQVNGICPAFTIDKTVNILIWLSKESLSVTNFTTSLSSEMNVSFPDGEDMKELPIPEQFVHKLVDGVVTSDVSDLYH